jgi:hypothetical protein
MSYVSSDGPLPQNSMSPPTPCQIHRNQQVVSAVETAVANAREASAMIAPPEAFAEFGQGVMRDVTRGQNELISGNTLTVMPHRNGSLKALQNAPQQVPLNVTQGEFSGCKVRGVTALAPVPMPKNAQKIVMPALAPTDTGLLTTGNTFPPAPRFVPGSGTSGPAPAPTRAMQYYSIVQNPGLRGMGIAWGDAVADQPRDGNGGVSGKSLLFLALAGLGLYAATRKGRR